MDEERLNPPYGGEGLCILLKTGKELEDLKSEIGSLTQWSLSDRQACDLELLMNGGFSPLRGFMNQETYQKVVEDMRLPSGLLWSMPITLDVTEDFAKSIKIGQRIKLLERYESIPLAILTVDSIWKPDKANEAIKVLGANDRAHPTVRYLFDEAGDYYIGGSIEGIQLPPHYDFTELRLTPAELRNEFRKKFWTRIVAFQTRNPMHRSHKELTVRASREAKANLLIHPVVGKTKPGDVDHYTRVRCYQAMMRYYPEQMAMLSLLPLAMRMAGPREALWHAIIRKNYGASHFIVGRDHAGPGKNSKGEDFYPVYAAQELLIKSAKEIGIEVKPFKMVVYVEDRADYAPEDEIPPGARILLISGTELRRRLFKGLPIPDWFSFPEVVKILQQSYPPRRAQGFTLFFTGLSSSGKSTIAHAIQSALLQLGGRSVSVLSGQQIRGLISSELTFSKTDRDLNLKRIGYIASEITKSGGIAILTSIAPYAKARKECREMISAAGGFIEIYLDTPLEVCEKRDRKGNYAKARKGDLANFTGISDPYEAPEAPEIRIDTSQRTVNQSVHEIMLYLGAEGFLDKDEKRS